MTSERMPAHNLAGARLLKPFSRTLMGLQLWHKDVLGDLAVDDDLIKIAHQLGTLGKSRRV